MIETLAPLALIVAAAFAVESIVGFGATVLVVTLGTWLVSLDRLLPAYVPANMALSAFVLARSHRDVDARLLTRRMLPWVGAGTLAGIALDRYRDARVPMVLYGVFVLWVAFERARATLRGDVAPAKAPGWLTVLGMTTGGMIFGLFGSGGPMIVSALGPEARDHATFRATLAPLWIALNLCLVARYATHGQITAASLTVTAALLPAALVGGVVGDQLHRRIPRRAMGLAIAALLAASGVAFIAHNL